MWFCSIVHVSNNGNCFCNDGWTFVFGFKEFSNVFLFACVYLKAGYSEDQLAGKKLFKDAIFIPYMVMKVGCRPLT